MDELLDANEVARLLKVRTSTVYEAVKKGRLPVVRLWQGERKALLRFQRGAIERLIRERTDPAQRS